MKTALVLLSGGQDSTTCLIQAIKQYQKIHCITFDYGQNHKKEISSAIFIAKLLGVKFHKVLSLPILNDISISSLIDKNISKYSMHSLNNMFPSTFVPGRNIVFFTIASIYSYNHKIFTIISGINETDFSGYPDCTTSFINAMSKTINIGLKSSINFENPVLNLSKGEIWALADYWNQIPLIRDHTITCYNGVKGKGCGNCSACKIRNQGFTKWKLNSNILMKSMKKKLGLI